MPLRDGGWPGMGMWGERVHVERAAAAGHRGRAHS